MKQDLSIIILAAGKGTRMKSDVPKVMHKIAGREMINLVLDEAKKLNPKEIAIVVSEDIAKYQDYISSTHKELAIKFVLQNQRKGTAHAALVGLSALQDLSQKRSEKILILYGDTPLICEKTLREMIEKIDDKNAVCVLGFETEFENQYGRLVVDENNNLTQIVEFKDADESQKEISLCNSGVIAVFGEKIDELLKQINNKNNAGEYYLTDIVKIARQKNLDCTFVKTNEEEVLGVNSRLELARVEDIKQNQMRQNFMEQGVSLLDPFSVYFSYDTKIANDVVIHQNVVFGTKVEIDKNVEIKSFCHIEGAKINQGAIIGPFARIRPDSEIQENVRIGNFVEVKNTKLKKGAKINHLSYIGDAEIGVNSNIGAGVITCNYDGFNKFKTEIGDEVFVGSNSALIAPLKIGDKALIGAGSVINKNVENDELAISRSLQKNIKYGASKFRAQKNISKNKKND